MSITHTDEGYVLAKPFYMLSSTAQGLYRRFIKDVVDTTMSEGGFSVEQEGDSVCPDYFSFRPKQESYEWKIAQLIHRHFKERKRYSVMFFEFNDEQKRMIARYVQAFLYFNDMVSVIWDNMDLTDPDLDINRTIFRYTEDDLPSIGVYNDIMKAYSSAVDNTEGSGYASSKTSMNQLFDKLGDTAGTITLVFCNSSAEELHTATKRWESDTGMKLESMYRVGRIDADIECRGESAVFTDKDTGMTAEMDITRSHHSLPSTIHNCALVTTCNDTLDNPSWYHGIVPFAFSM
jgi:hypothetical protein